MTQNNLSKKWKKMLWSFFFSAFFFCTLVLSGSLLFPWVRGVSKWGWMDEGTGIVKMRTRYISTHLITYCLNLFLGGDFVLELKLHGITFIIIVVVFVMFFLFSPSIFRESARVCCTLSTLSGTCRWTGNNSRRATNWKVDSTNDIQCV